jgi:DNA-binding transcriptional regulator GbsR (MarR family)
METPMDNVESNPIDPNLNPDLWQFIENIARYYEGYGIPRIGGRMFALLLVMPTPLSAEQIAELLKASRSSVSTNVRGLVANGWVEKVTVLGDRTEYYRFSPTAWDRVIERRRQAFAPLIAMVNQAQGALPDDHAAQVQLATMSDWATLMMHHYESLIALWQARQSDND